MLGREFSFDVLCAMAASGEDRLIAELEEAVAARLIVEAHGCAVPAYTFTHALVRETLYRSLSGPRRRRLHADAAHAIEQIEGNPEVAELAHHWYYAGDHGARRRRASRWHSPATRETRPARR